MITSEFDQKVDQHGQLHKEKCYEKKHITYLYINWMSHISPGFSAHYSVVLSHC